MKKYTDIDEFLQYVISYFGIEKQMVVAIEEMAELTQALSKHIINHSNKSRDSVVEEYVDVLIMLNQIKIIFEITDDEEWLRESHKYERLEKYIESRK